MNSNALARNINNLTRLFYVISLFVVYFIKVPILYFYIIFFFLNVEILLLKKSQSNTKIFKTTQVFFTLFVSYVLFVRAHMCGFSLTTEDNLNTVEHLLFAFVISLMIYYYCIFVHNLNFYNILEGKYRDFLRFYKILSYKIQLNINTSA